MGRLGVFVVAGALTIVGAAGARGADMPRLPSIPLPFPDKTPLIEEFVSGWYIRGDLGYRFQDVDGASHISGAHPTINTIDDVMMAGVGFGYKAKWLRLDLTTDYGLRGNYNGSVGSSATTYSARLDSYTVMLNGYFDLGTWYGFTPYVGGGVGAAYLSTSNYQTTPTAATSTGSVNATNFAWAAMGGISYQLMHNLLIDVSYRHVAMGDADAGPGTSRLTINDVTGDEIRVGIRYLLD